MTVVALAFLLSGAAALVYQVAWQRLLVLQSGVGIYSVAMIVAAFMAGLGIGHYVGGVWSARLSQRRALVGFAAIELGVGLFGAASCILFYDWLYLKGAWLYASPWRAGLLHFAGLLLPTGLMGTSLPFLVRASVATREGAGRTIGLLYAVNTLGAALGALIAPWLLLRLLGVRGAVLVAALGNLVAATLAVATLYRRAPGTQGEEAAAEAGEATASGASGQPFPMWVALYTLSGFVALSLEILWFRIVDVAVKATAFTFGTVLALYLGGLGLGTLLGILVLPRLRRPLTGFLLCQCALLLYAGLAVSALVWLPTQAPGYAWYFAYWRESRGFALGASWDLVTLARLYLLLPLLLYGPPTLLMGLSFPILQRAVQDEPRTSGRKVGMLQAANIVGCVVGSLLVGLVGLSVLKSSGSLRLLLLCGLVFASVGMVRTTQRVAFAGLGLALGLLAAAVPDQQQLWSRLHGSGTDTTLVAEDASGVPVLSRTGRRWRMTMNGIPHSWLPYGGVHTALGALPALIHEEPRSVAVIGLGSGDTAWASGLRPETSHIRVFEICRPQLALLNRVVETRVGVGGLRRFLADPRVDLVFADGRNALEVSADRYDVIQMDPLHPESAWSGNLYSLEFFQLAASRLRPGGVMSTWVPTARTHSTFTTVFPHVIQDGAGILLGSNEPLPVKADLWLARLKKPAARAYLGERAVSELAERIRGIVPSDPPAPGRILPNSDLFPRDEFARHWRDG